MQFCVLVHLIRSTFPRKLILNKETGNIYIKECVIDGQRNGHFSCLYSPWRCTRHAFLMGWIHFLPPGVACTTGLSHNPFTWHPL